MEPVRSTFRVTGLVQGVGFRWWACTQARALGLSGWVRNEVDGAVSGRAEGPEAALGAFRELLGRGPEAARVAQVAWGLDAAAEVEGQSLPFPYEIRR